VFIRSAWPVIILWYGALFIFLVSTDNGKSTRHYLLNFFCRGRNESVAEEIIREENTIRERVRAATRAQQRRMQRIRRKSNNCLALKVKKFKSPEKQQQEAGAPPRTPDTSFEDDDDEEVCTICMCEIVDGDRIGALKCKHNFHVNCLKQWLRRKNVCPLCLVPNVASPRCKQQQQSRRDDDAYGDNISWILNGVGMGERSVTSLTIDTTDTSDDGIASPPAPRNRDRRQRRLTFTPNLTLANSLGSNRGGFVNVNGTDRGWSARTRLSFFEDDDHAAATDDDRVDDDFDAVEMARNADAVEMARASTLLPQRHF